MSIKTNYVLAKTNPVSRYSKKSKIDRLVSYLKLCKDKSVTVEINGAISVPYFIDQFKISATENNIAFGDVDCENFPFIINKESICDINFIDEYDVHLEFSIVDNYTNLVTTLIVYCGDANIFG